MQAAFQILQAAKRILQAAFFKLKRGKGAEKVLSTLPYLFQPGSGAFPFNFLEDHEEGGTRTETTLAVDAVDVETRSFKGQQATLGLLHPHSVDEGEEVAVQMSVDAARKGTLGDVHLLGKDGQ